jgi:hypothetical protein
MMCAISLRAMATPALKEVCASAYEFCRVGSKRVWIFSGFRFLRHCVMLWIAAFLTSGSLSLRRAVKV